MWVTSKLRSWQKRLTSVYHCEGAWSFELSGDRFSGSGIDSMSLMNNRTNFIKESEMVEDLLRAVDTNDAFCDVGTDMHLYTVVVGDEWRKDIKIPVPDVLKMISMEESTLFFGTLRRCSRRRVTSTARFIPT